MEGPPIMINTSSIINSPSDSQPLYGASPYPSEGRPNSTNEAFPTKPEEQAASKENASRPAFPSASEVLSDSLIPPGQKTTVQTTPASWKIPQESLGEYDRDSVGKYAFYLQDKTILSIPVIMEALDLRIITLVVDDIKMRRFAGLKKDSFEDLMRTAGIPEQYFY